MVLAACPQGLGMPWTRTIRKPGWSTISLNPRYWSMAFSSAPSVDANPAPVGDIRDAVFIAQIFAPLELSFQHFEQAPAFVVVALDSRWQFFWKIAVEHVGLP